MKKSVLAVAAVILLLVLLCVVLLPQMDQRTIRREEGFFRNLYAEKAAQLTELMELVLVDRAGSGFSYRDGTFFHYKTGVEKEMDVSIEVAALVTELFGQQGVAIGKKDGASIVRVSRTFKIVGSLLRQDWMEVDLWYFQDPEDPAARDTVDFIRNRAAWLDGHFAITVYGLL